MPIALVSYSPFMEKMLVAFDASEEWQEQEFKSLEDGLKSSSLTWKLHKGENTLKCRVLSAKGRLGRVCSATVIMP